METALSLSTVGQVAAAAAAERRNSKPDGTTVTGGHSHPNLPRTRDFAQALAGPGVALVHWQQARPRQAATPSVARAALGLDRDRDRQTDLDGRLGNVVKMG